MVRLLTCDSSSISRANLAMVEPENLPAAQAVSIPQDREILHVLPQEFVLDDQGGIHAPKGMIGSRLEANVHIVTAATTAIQNLVTCANRAGIEVRDTVLEQLAIAETVLTPDERARAAAQRLVTGDAATVVSSSVVKIRPISRARRTIPSPLSEATEGCLLCHESLHPGIVADWRRSRHSRTTVAEAPGRVATQAETMRPAAPRTERRARRGSSRTTRKSPWRPFTRKRTGCTCARTRTLWPRWVSRPTPCCRPWP